MGATDPNEEFERTIKERYADLEVIPAENATLGAGPKDRSTYTKELTPIDEFYVLNHYPTPEIDGDEWTVSLTGDVKEATLTMAKLREEFPTATATHTMECAGNGRSYFSDVDGEPERYMQWGYNGAGTAEWTGTPLSAVLEANGAETGDGTWLTAIGGDAPDGDADIFARSLPMSKVMDDCLLAYGMNGEPLPPEHGYPVRVIVPGWYGVNSVKWVEELRVMDRMIAGEKWDRYTHWQQDFYRLKFDDETPAERDGLDEFDTWDQLAAESIPNPYLYDQNVMSLIGYPDDGDAVESGADGRVEVLGVAWAGDDRVEAVEVSADGGETWHEARFAAPDAEPTAWRLFRCVLNLPPGDHHLVSRATDERDRSQPELTSEPGSGKTALADDEYPWNREGYGHNAYLDYGVEFTVRR